MKPPSCSFASAKGPSWTRRLPFRARTIGAVPVTLSAEPVMYAPDATSASW
jgi:hypothetical protein